jgi:hypothetical protein
MFEKVNALLETEGAVLVEKHEDVIVEAMTVVNDFQKDLKAFILNNPQEFIGENTDETYKNMRVFAEVGTAQFVSEISNIYGTSLQEPTVVEEETKDKDAGIKEYL